jgi:hypothetical protein
MTAKQFNSPEGQKLRELQYKHDALLKKQGYYSKGVAKLSDRIRKQAELVERLYPEADNSTSNWPIETSNNLHNANN